MLGSLLLALLMLSVPMLARARSQDQNADVTPNPPAVERAERPTKADLAVPLCPAAFEDGLEKDGIAFRGENGVTPPKPLYMPPGEMTKEAFGVVGAHGAYFFDVVVNGIVDVNGVVQNVCISRSEGLGLDASAAGNVRNYRFEPATKEGKPVPFRVKVEVTFKRRY
jgi:TonB family protein